MKQIILIFAFLLATVWAFGQTSTWVNGYFKKDGTYVQGHYRTNPDHTNHNNWSTQQNYNPYSNTQGSRARDYSTQAYNYGSGRTIYTGPRGGQYYINSRGNKVYVPKRGY